ncbi:hypothetical protein DEJ36_00920 [Curtobacterium sp. MCPF17_052]|nr:hypothetical protein [Curtobacterium sp. MCPF17_052]WIB14074.1 hypothetical protein DEJ36_00920 [Curtobacterium sp. MCPF17_052]
MYACGTTSSPSGLARLDASFATNFVDAAPTEQCNPVSANTVRRISVPICHGVP